MDIKGISIVATVIRTVFRFVGSVINCATIDINAVRIPDWWLVSSILNNALLSRLHQLASNNRDSGVVIRSLKNPCAMKSRGAPSVLKFPLGAAGVTKRASNPKSSAAIISTGNTQRALAFQRFFVRLRVSSAQQQTPTLPPFPRRNLTIMCYEHAIPRVMETRHF